MIYAQIKDGVVSNIIVLNDEQYIPLFSQGFDELLRVDQLLPYPSPGWTYDGQDFFPPEQEEERPENLEALNQKIESLQKALVDAKVIDKAQLINNQQGEIDA